jgi:hypothetical protein
MIEHDVCLKLQDAAVRAFTRLQVRQLSQIPCYLRSIIAALRAGQPSHELDYGGDAGGGGELAVRPLAPGLNIELLLPSLQIMNAVSAKPDPSVQDVESVVAVLTGGSQVCNITSISW